MGMSDVRFCRSMEVFVRKDGKVEPRNSNLIGKTDDFMGRFKGVVID